MFGPIANPCLRVIVGDCCVSYKWQILFKTIASGQYGFEQVEMYLHQLSPQSGYELVQVSRNTLVMFVSRQKTSVSGVSRLTD